MNHQQTRIRQISLTGLLCFAGFSAFGHGVVPNVPASERDIHFPDVKGYQTLVLDLHTHSVFSDGHVWPTIRVAEAERDGWMASRSRSTLSGSLTFWIFRIQIEIDHLIWQPRLLKN